WEIQAFGLFFEFDAMNGACHACSMPRGIGDVLQNPLVVAAHKKSWFFCPREVYCSPQRILIN
ncbi:MAG: hypothetical protein RL258_35, partial [Pseudomonadota bacterium]